jgi:hypothetical protein
MRHTRFTWLEPPSFAGGLTAADIAAAATPAARTEQARPYIHDVWDRWAAAHAAIVAGWYAQYVTPERV